tara:strand:+ start:6576 stop:6740 length:165 start_codon:yes stop_codon:yes gene_type:complete
MGCVSTRKVEVGVNAMALTAKQKKLPKALQQAILKKMKKKGKKKKGGKKKRSRG